LGVPICDGFHHCANRLEVAKITTVVIARQLSEKGVFIDLPDMPITCRNMTREIAF